MKLTWDCLVGVWLLVTFALPAAAGAAPPQQPDLLGEEFRSVANGIALRPPANCDKIPTPPGEIAEFSDDQRHWLLKVRRLTFAHPLPLSLYKDQFGEERQGLMELTLNQFRNQSTTHIITHQIVHIGDKGQTPAGIIVLRFAQNFEQHVLQEALVQANEQLYYLVDLTTLGRSDTDTGPENPEERAAADAFNQVIDSIRLLDRSVIFHDQADRLIRTRGLLANWSPGFLALRLVPEQYFRLVRDGKDIGYVYEVEEYDDKAGRIGGVPIVRILQRSDSEPAAGTVVDAQSRMISTVDLKHEDWVNLAIVSMQPPPAPGEDASSAAAKGTLFTEVGVSDQRTKAIPLVAPGGDIVGPADTGHPTIQPGLRMTETWRLAVTRSTADALHPSIKRDLPPYQQDLPAFYVPQALGHIAPRLFTDLSPRTYLFATYVPDGDNGQPAVMLRYMDVLAPAEVSLGGRLFTAVPVTDHVGLEGPVTTHYLNPDDGSYLGCSTSTMDKDGHTTVQEIIPTDAATLHKIWPNCNLSRPDRIVEVGKGQ